MSRIEELEQMLPAMEDKMNQAEALAKSVMTFGETTTCQEDGNLQCEIMMVKFENEILHKEKTDLGLLLSQTTSTKEVFSAEMIHERRNSISFPVLSQSSKKTLLIASHNPIPFPKKSNFC